MKYRHMKKSLTLISKQTLLPVIMLVSVALASSFFTAQYYKSDENLLSKKNDIPKATSEITAQNSGEKLEPVDVLLSKLKQRLEKQPDDVDGWLLLSKSYFHLNRAEEAKSAFDHAKMLGYNGNWQPLPRIDSLSQKLPSSFNLNSIANFRNHKIGDNGS